MTNITCIVCGKVLEPVVTDTTFYGEMEYAKDMPNVQPYDGVVFTATGNYGSAVHDPYGPEAELLVAVVCDECVTKYHDRLHTMRNAEDIDRFDPLDYLVVVDLPDAQED